jgi:hypothetical protein
VIAQNFDFDTLYDSKKRLFGTLHDTPKRRFVIEYDSSIFVALNTNGLKKQQWNLKIT